MISHRKPSTAYTIKITLDDTKPPIWRSFKVRGEITLGGRRDVALAVMGWSGYHMHLWRIGRERFGVMDDDTIDENTVLLCDIAQNKFSLMYDMGDGWEHTLVVEKIDEDELECPTCIEGELACPPEDCGGPWGFYDKLKILKKPNHEEIKEWMGDFDPQAFDLDAVNELLRQGGALQLDD